MKYRGNTRVPERFCVDWNKIDDAGNFFQGDYNKCENWYVYGEQVYAVAEGQVVSVKDGMPDQSPVFTQPIPTTLFDGEGNSVVIHINGGYVVYGHLIPNSINVIPGQLVKNGSVIGKVGNSGDSDATHLHFGLHTDFPYYISEGLPYYYNTLEKIGSIGKLGGSYIKFSLPETHINELVENWGVYNLK
ncbi:MAG: M23 family metallopeptidase [Ignavibacteriales bacterium]|nr:M23 family metallopeptidase [Ignavibacteriales bacterium]